MTRFSSRRDLENWPEWRVRSVCLIMQTLVPGARQAGRRARPWTWGWQPVDSVGAGSRQTEQKQRHRVGPRHRPHVSSTHAAPRFLAWTCSPPGLTPSPCTALLQHLSWLPSTCESAGSGSRALLPCLQAQPFHFLAVWPWANYLTSLPQSFIKRTLTEHLACSQVWGHSREQSGTASEQ